MRNKGKFMSMVFALVAMCGVKASADSVMRLQMQHPVEIRKPILTDTLNVKGEKHDVEKLMLESPVNLNLPSQDCIALSADSADRFHLPATENGYRIYVVRTKLRADRFVKTKLSFATLGRMELYINGERLADKMSRQDSIDDNSYCRTDLRMEPGELYDVALKVLVEPADTVPVELRATWNATDSTVSVACAPDLKGRYLLPNTVFGKKASQVRISPDGKYLLTQYTEWYSLKRSNVYTVLTEIQSGKTLATFTQGAKQMAWMPRSSKLYYTVTSDQGVKLLTVDPKTLAETVVADNVPEGNFHWSPDEKALFFVLPESIEAEKQPVHRLLDPSDRIPGARKRWFIARYDLATGLREQLTCGLHTTSLQDISEDGRYLLYTVSESTPDKWPFSKSGLFCLDTQSMKVDTLVAADYFMGGASFSPDANQILLTGGPEAFGGIGKNCGSHPIANNYDGQAFLMNRSTGDIEPITKDFAPSVTPLQWNRNDGCIYFKTSDADREPIYRYDPHKRLFEKLPLEGDCVRAFSLASDAPEAAYISVTASSGPAAYLFHVKKAKSDLLADPYSETLAVIEMGEIHDWNFRASDNTLITGYYCLPPAFDPNKKYPLIVYYYGGTTPTVRSMDNPYAAQLFASRGYVVYVVNPSGTIGFGQEFSARHVNAWGQRTADDIIEGTKQFCAEHPFVNDKKIGCLGASYGGFMTQYLQTRTDLFAAAASHAGISNVTSYWGEGYWGVGYNAVAAAQSYPWSHPELFTRQGSLFNADKINTPLLLLHGTSDTNVPIGESIQLYNALKILGKTVEFIQVDGEDHFIADYPKRVLWHNSIMAWFARWLQDAPQWWNDLYPDRQF